MEITIMYYGKLEEIVGKKQEVLNKDFISIDNLELFLRETYPQLATTSFKIAQNNSIATKESPISSTQIDIFPPFSGG
jgi:molybdopterin converting factor small subunit